MVVILGVKFARDDTRLKKFVSQVRIPLISCSQCGGRTLVKSTIKAYDVIIRYRKCVECGSTLKSVGRI